MGGAGPTQVGVAVLGAGQAGLAMSRCLTARSIDHVLIERGEVGSSWRTERWDSLRLLTPNWMSRLPGHSYDGDDPNGFMTSDEVVEHLVRYRCSFDAPVQANTTVRSVRERDAGYEVRTDQGTWTARAVVVATGACSTPHVPALAGHLPASIRQLSPIHYRNPAEVEDGRVLVVGASASGVQLAEELQRAGREVTLAVGEHVRAPRSYRGRDIHWWMDRLGILDERFDAVEDLTRARRLHSLQLVGSPERRSLDLNALAEIGVELVGRFVGVVGTRAQLSGDLANNCASADLKMDRLLDQIDRRVAMLGLDRDLPPPDRPRPTTTPRAETSLDLRDVRTVIWATGFRPSYPWLERHLLDGKGGIRHHGGIMERPGMYVLGLPFTRRRKSSFLDGVGPDAVELAGHLAHHLDATASRCG
jgi:putative flavoprotein involved in K+ transport